MASMEGNIADMERCIRRGADVHADKEQALHLAAAFNQLGAVKMLLKHNALVFPHILSSSNRITVDEEVTTTLQKARRKQRFGPSAKASDPSLSLGAEMEGNDREMWVLRVRRNGVRYWKRE